MFEWLKFRKKCSSTEVGSQILAAIKALDERMANAMTQLQNDVNQETSLLQQLKAAATTVGGLLAAQSQSIADLKAQLAAAGTDPAIVAQIEANNAEVAAIIGGLVTAAQSATPATAATAAPAAGSNGATAGATVGTADATINNA